MSLSSQLKLLLNSPRGRRLVEQGRQQLSKPENQAKIRNAMNKLGHRR